MGWQVRVREANREYAKIVILPQRRVNLVQPETVNVIQTAAEP